MFYQFYIYKKEELDNNPLCGAYKIFSNGKNAHEFANKLSNDQDIYVYKIDVAKFSMLNKSGILDITFYPNKKINKLHTNYQENNLIKEEKIQNYTIKEEIYQENEIIEKEQSQKIENKEIIVQKFENIDNNEIKIEKKGNLLVNVIKGFSIIIIGICKLIYNLISAIGQNLNNEKSKKKIETNKPDLDSKRYFTSYDKGQIWDRQNGKCAKCKKQLNHDTVDYDHIKPWAKGGKTIPSNGQALCAECHAKKTRKEHSLRKRKHFH